MILKRLIYVTGTRADYSPMRSILIALREDPGVDLGLIVTGMHLSSRYGHTIDLIVEDGLRVLSSIPMLGQGDSPADMVAAVSRLMGPLAEVLTSERPDGLVVTGDRGEMLAAAICGAHLGIPVLHFCGGSISGSIDDSIRHAITRFAHIHFPSTPQSLENLIRMGEDPRACFLVGLPGANLAAEATATRREIEAELGFQLADRYAVVIQHPVTHERECAASQMENTLQAVLDLGIQVVVFLPNSDAGGQQMTDVIRQYAARYKNMHLVDNLPRRLFASLLAGCEVLVGNSSCGIGEAISLGIPVVNIGTRQRDRERMGNTIDVGYGTDEIKQGLHEALHSNAYRSVLADCRNEYLRDDTERRVVSIIKNLDLRQFVPKRRLWPDDGLNTEAERITWP